MHGSIEELAPVVATLRRTGAVGVAELSAEELRAGVASRMATLGLATPGDYAARLRDGDLEHTLLLTELLERSSRRNRQTRLLEAQTRVLRGLSAGAALEQILLETVCEAESLSEGVRCSVLLVSDDGRHLCGGPAPSLPAALRRAGDGLRIGPDAGSCGAAAALGRRVVVEDVLTHPNWGAFRELAREAGMRACWSEPFLSSRGDVLGTFAMYLAEPRGPTPEEIEVIEAMSALAGISVERKRTEEELVRAREDLERRVRERTECLEAANDELRRLSTELLMAEDRERRNLAVDLHDGLSQILSLACVKLSEAARRAVGEGARELSETQALLRQANRTVRSLTLQLSPPFLDTAGLVSMLSWLAADMGRTYGLTVEVVDDGRDEPVGRPLRTTLFRSVRELLINVAKHSGVMEARVCVTREDGYVRIEVVDRGSSFDESQVRSGAYGLRAVRERLRHLDGEMRVLCGRGEDAPTGTTVVLRVPEEGNTPS